MKKRGKKLTSLLLAVIMAVTSFVFSPVLADAAVIDAQIATVDLWASCTDAQAGGELGTVRAHYIESTASGNVYLFLPSQADLNNVKIMYSASSCTINGTAISNGAATNLFASGGKGETYSLTLGSASYTLAVYKSSQVGAVYFNTTSGNTDNIDYSTSNSEHTVSESGTIMVVEPDGTVDYNGVLEKIQGRGNGTWSETSKKLPYNIKLAVSTSLLGMGQAKKWVLLANDGEDTLINNWLSYDFAKYIGIPYQVVGKPVDVYANGKYMGNYLLTEKVEIKSNRVAINDSYEALEIANGTTDAATGVVTPADFSTMSNITTRYLDSSDKDLTAPSSYLTGMTVGNRKFTAIKESAGITGSTTTYSDLTDPADLTGGYIYELEISNRWINENAGFCAYNRQGWVIKSHDYASRSQVDYSYNLLYALGSSVYNGGTVPSSSTTTNCSSLGSTFLYGAKSITNPAPSVDYQGQKWSDLLDATSAVRYYWTQEYFKNMDASTSSTYFCKDSGTVDSKLYAGPVWDMDNAIGGAGESSRWGYDINSATGWYVKNTRIYRWRTNDSTKTYSSDAYSPLTFYGALATNCTDFWDMVQEEWFTTVKPATQILLGNASDPTGTLKSVDEYIDIISDSGTMNNVRYGLGAYDAEGIKATLNTWFSNRNTFVDGEFSQVNIATVTTQAIPGQYYTGSEICPEVIASYTSSGNTTKLVEGVHYTLTYADNINVGKGSVTLTGIGRFTGTLKISYYIIANDISNGSLKIYDGAYIGDVVVPTLTDKNGIQITGGVTYDWYLDGVKASTGDTYTVAAEDAGKTLTVTATGDKTSVTGSLTSNSCLIASTTRPSGIVKNIATFSYKYGDDGLSLQGSKTNGYNATAGVQKDTAKLYASVDGVNKDNLEWSGSDTFTRTDLTTGQQPVMSPSTNTPWGEYPYFDITFSSTGYSDITFKADIGATSKGAAYYALQYSVNGGEFNYIYGPDPADEYDYLYYELTAVDKKIMKTAFDLTLPEECNNADSVTVRIIVDDIYTLDGNPTLFTTTKSNGKIAVNNIYVDGVKSNDVTSLDPPVIETVSEYLFKDDAVTITDTNSGADVYYTLTDANGTVSQVYSYTEPFMPFEAVASSSVTVTAWSEYGIYKSDEVTQAYAFAGEALARFDNQTYSSDVINGAVQSTGGAFGNSSLMTTVVYGTNQYVPLYNDDKKAFALSPDDGIKWSADSGFYFEFCTGGYDNITFSCDAYTTTQGAKSMTLAYSTDKETWTTVVQNQPLPAAGTLENYMDKVVINGIGNADKVYIRLVSEENLTSSGELLHNNLSKGNVYINNIIIGGTAISGVLKTPYTNKSTDYFGLTGVIKYYSPDGAQLNYTVADSAGKIVSSGIYPSAGIQLASMAGFSNYSNAPYTVTVWAGDDDNISAYNIRRYYYKGDTIAEFDYNSTRFDASVNSDSLSVNATSGTGTLAMYPNGTDAASLTYTSSYGVKVSATAENSWATDCVVNNQANKGYWLVQTSTLGCTGLTLSLEQVSSEKGPRDWGIAYSTDGINYQYLDYSNSRAIISQQTVQTYSNIPLPEALWDKETVYIKVFINGGENIAGYELADTVNSVGKGNTGINNIELCGLTGEPDEFSVSINTVVLETLGATSGTAPLAGVDVYVDNVLAGTTDENGSVSCMLSKGAHTVFLDNTTFSRTVEITVAGVVNESFSVPLVALDADKNGIINIRDYSLIIQDTSNPNALLYDNIFMEFINVTEAGFTYQ